MLSPSSRVPVGTGTGGQFEQVAAPLANELLSHLEQEHQREVLVLYEEQIRLREELRRVVDLMQREVIPRERQLHDMFEKLTSAFTVSSQNLRQQHEDMHTRMGQSSRQHDAMRRQLLDPLQESENELSRMESMLSHPPVTSSDVPPQLLQQVHTKVLTSVQGSTGAASFSSSRSTTCANCGNIFAVDAVYCRKCGMKRDQMQTQASPMSPVARPQRLSTGTGQPSSPPGYLESRQVLPPPSAPSGYGGISSSSGAAWRN
eukprot:TRINITY_DN80719_c0_g1_i1.p1 TRINITY_DN80719_c0_g1~~TRINITY_DN80719_c0_g1_i1.p1  ORF type:complete len:260 (-),score=50.81 TRINITY_DN80719_c0_g1_i1:243-1022(-)